MRRFLRRLFDPPRTPHVDLAVNDEFNWLLPPRDVHDAGAWDAYWNNQIAHGLGPAIFDMFCDVEAIVAALHVNEFRSVLCVGAGISREPQALADAGFDVTALDLSSVAIELAERTLRESEHRPQYVVGDLIDSGICPGPFDMVIERRTLQLFPAGERSIALATVADRLGARGLFFSHCHDGCWKPPAEPIHATRSWFCEHGWTIWRQDKPVAGRSAWLFTSTG